MVPPTVSVAARYPGASAQTLIDTIALPIEQQVNGVEHMLYMQSTSGNDGSYALTITFEIGTDLNTAQVLVQNRVLGGDERTAADGAVPGRHRAEEEHVDPADRHPHFARQIQRRSLPQQLRHHQPARRTRPLPGVGNVTVFGAGSYAMRIWMDPGALQSRGLAPADVISAIQAQSRQVPAGQLGAPPTGGQQNFQYTLNVAGRLSDPAEFGAIVIRANGTGGAVTRVRDVARVELGAQSYNQVFRVDGAPGRRLGHLPDTRRQRAGRRPRP